MPAKQEIKPIPGAHFVTITLDPKSYKFCASVQHDMTVNFIETLLYDTCSNFQCTPELTEDGNVHYHAWLIFNDITSRMIFIDRIKRNRLLGFMKINKEVIAEEHVGRVQEYLCKSFDITCKVIKTVRRNLIITRDNMVANYIHKSKNQQPVEGDSHSVLDFITPRAILPERVSERGVIVNGINKIATTVEDKLDFSNCC